MRIRMMAIVPVLLISVGLNGCMDNVGPSVLPQGGPTMDAIYRQHSASLEDHAITARAQVAPLTDEPARPSETVAYDRTHFPKLPNPDLVMYIYPHIATASQLVVPGYSVAFPLYDRTYYALPGEVVRGGV